MGYTTSTRVRNLFGFSENDIDPPALEELIPYVDAEIDSLTGQIWAKDSTYYAKIQEAATIMVGSLVFKRFHDKQQLSEHLWAEGKKKLEEISEIPFVAYEDPLV